MNLTTQLFDNIKTNTNVRNTLSALRQEIKDESVKLRLCQELNLDASSDQILISLLTHEDPKTRKNVALLMGDLAFPTFLTPIFQAYQIETTLFVKSSYLSAMKNFNYSSYLSSLKESRQKLIDMEITPETKKHIENEIRELNELILLEEGFDEHNFTGFNLKNDIILLTNRLHTSVIKDQIDQACPKNTVTKEFNAGVQVSTKNIQDILPIRTYNELLFRVEGATTCQLPTPLSIPIDFVNNLVAFLEKRHDGSVPFYFRLELKSKLPLDKKAILAKKISSELERISNRKLINSTTHYEIELRLIESKTGCYNALVKLFTLPDHRFQYKMESIAASIKPVNAALLVTLAQEYMKPNAKVLDPFCGVGTMLIERQFQVKANTSYGIDIFGAAIDKARINTDFAGQIVHYINRDFNDFTHEHLFDQVITNLPFSQGHTTKDQIYTIYQMFFRKIGIHLTPDATLILYTHDEDFVHELAPNYGFYIEKNILVNEREHTNLLILVRT